MKNDRRKITSLLVAMLLVSMVFMTACSGDDDDDYQDLLIEFNIFTRLFAEDILPYIIDQSRSFQIEQIKRNGALVGIINKIYEHHQKALVQTYTFLFKKSFIMVDGKSVASKIDYRRLTEYLVKFQNKINDIVARSRKK